MAKHSPDEESSALRPFADEPYNMPYGCESCTFDELPKAGVYANVKPMLIRNGHLMSYGQLAIKKGCKIGEVGGPLESDIKPGLPIHISGIKTRPIINAFRLSDSKLESIVFILQTAKGKNYNCLMVTITDVGSEEFIADSARSAVEECIYPQMPN